MVKEENINESVVGHSLGTSINGILIIINAIFIFTDVNKRKQHIALLLIALFILVIYYVVKYEGLIKNNTRTDIWDWTYLALTIIINVWVSFLLLYKVYPVPYQMTLPYPYNQ